MHEFLAVPLGVGGVAALDVLDQLRTLRATEQRRDQQHRIVLHRDGVGAEADAVEGSTLSIRRVSCIILRSDPAQRCIPPADCREPVAIVAHTAIRPSGGSKAVAARLRLRLIAGFAPDRHRFGRAKNHAHSRTCAWVS